MGRQIPEKPSNQSPAHRSVQQQPTVVHVSLLSSVLTCGLTSCLLSAVAIIIFSIVGVTFARARFEEFVCNVPVLRLCKNGLDVEPGPPTIDEIRALGWLETLEVDFSTTVKVINRRGTWPVQADEVLIYNVCGRATAGIDFEKLEKQDVRINRENVGDTITFTITITLPQAEVLAVNPSDDTFSIDPALKVPAIPEYPLKEDKTAELLLACNDAIVWDVPFGFDKTPSLIRDAEEQAMIQFRAFAEKEYVLELAQQNAKRELERFLKLAGYQEVSFGEVPE